MPCEVELYTVAKEKNFYENKVYVIGLCRYLQEIGYADTIIDVRSARVRQLLGVQRNGDEPSVNGGNEQPGSKRPNDGQSRRLFITAIVILYDIKLYPIEKLLLLRPIF